MNLILFDDPSIRASLLPLTLTRPVAEIRIGILTIAEKWERYFQSKPFYSTQDYLSKKFVKETSADNLWINGAVCPNTGLVEAIKNLKPGDAIHKNSMLIAVRTDDDELPEVISGKATEYSNDIVLIDKLWKIFQNNGNQIRADFKLITAGRKSAEIKDPHTHVYNLSEIFIEEGVVLHGAL